MRIKVVTVNAVTSTLAVLLICVACFPLVSAQDVSCGLRPETRGTMTATIDGHSTAVTCFSGEVHGSYATVLVGLSSNPDGGMVLRFLSRPTRQSCRTPVSVGIDYHTPTHLWTAYSSATHEFGDCAVAQRRTASGWSGHVTAELVSLKGNKTSGSPTLLHSEKDSSGKPLIKVTIYLPYHDSRDRIKRP